MKLVVSSKLRINIQIIYSGILALLPILMYVNVPGVNLGLGTVLLIAFSPYALFRSIKFRKEIRELPFFLVLGYILVRSMDEIASVIFVVLILIHIHGALNNSIDIGVVRKVMQAVAVLGTYCVIIQLAFYYVLGIRFSFLPSFLVAEEFQYYYSTAIGSIYRPSAFFLEPSHYAQYICISLLFTFFPENAGKVEKNKVFWIILGCLLTTSGMGIVLCIGVCGWYLLFNRMRAGKKIIYIAIGFFVAIIAFVLLMQVPFFALSVQRIFGEVDGYNAIEGRTWLWEGYIGAMSAGEKIIGRGVSNIPEGYMTGVMHMIYCYGYIGLSLLVSVYVYLFIKTRSTVSRCLCVMYIGMLMVANLVGYIYLMFWICIIVSTRRKTN